MPAPQSAQPLDGGRCRSQNPHAVFFRGFASQIGQLMSRLPHRRLFFSPHDAAHQMDERRSPHAPARLQLLFGKANEVVSGRQADRRLIRCRRLHDHTSTLRTAAGATGHLRDQLKGSLGSAEVRLVQGGIGIDDSHQRDVGEIEPLGDHLRAQQNAHFAGAKGLQGFIVAAPPPHGVAVHPQTANVGELGLHFALEPLGSHAQVLQPRLIAGGTSRRRWNAVFAQVAQRRILDAMPRQRDVAVGTTKRLAATPAPQYRGMAADVQEQNHLPPVGQRTADARFQHPADRMTPLDLRVTADVDDSHRRQRPAAYPFG